MNDGICPDLTSVVYVSVDNAVKINHHLGLGTELVLKDTYRVILATDRIIIFLGSSGVGICLLTGASPSTCGLFPRFSLLSLI